MEKPPPYSPPQPGQYGVPPQGQYSQPYPAGYQTGAPPGYQPLPNQQLNAHHPATTVIVQPQSSVVVVGGCPACRVGVLEDDFTCFGVCCAILFFPIGILCCLAMRQRRCPHCGAVFS